MPRPTALVTGASGQDASFLLDQLLAKGYDVLGVSRSAPGAIAPLVRQWQTDLQEGQRFVYHSADLTDAQVACDLLKDFAPEEIYNLAGQSHVPTSFRAPLDTLDVNGSGAVHLLEAMRTHTPRARMFQALSAEIFGPSGDGADEETPLQPVSPYGASKAYAAWMVRIYRQAHGLHASSGIFFSHESERRPESFVTRKITRSLARIKFGKQEVLLLGNLEARRDWGYAPDYVEAAWKMLQRDEPDDYVIATGVAHSVRDFVEAAARAAGFELEWQGEGLEEIAIERETGKTLVSIDPHFYRPVDIDALYGDATKAKTQLGWAPTVGFESLVARMIEADLARESDTN